MSVPMGHDPAEVVDVRQERSIGDLFGELTRDLSTLLRKELELAKIELKEEVAKGGKAGGMLGGTAVAGMMSLLLLSFALAWGLAEIMPTGFAFLLVGLIYAAVAAALYFKGKEELAKVRPVPEQTIETLKEDAAWARQQMR